VVLNLNASFEDPSTAFAFACSAYSGKWSINPASPKVLNHPPAYLDASVGKPPICSEISAIEAFAFLNWIMCMLFLLAITQIPFE
jgi:hypothetical protein